MSVATVMTTATVILIGYRVGRAHAAWADFRRARRDVPAKRRIAWAHTRPLLLGSLFVVGVFMAAAYDAAH